MNGPSASVLVSATEDKVFIKITGRANFSSSVNFKALLNGFLDKNYRRFVIDLTDCLLMDSTFLGVMAGFGLRQAKATDDSERAIELLNPNQRISDLLENLGVAHLFRIGRGKPFSADKMDAPEASSTTPSREEMSRTSLDAHRTLMDINPDNIPKFKDVAQFLAEDLAKLKSRS